MLHTDTLFRTDIGTSTAAKSLVTIGGARHLHLASWTPRNVFLTPEERDLLVEGYVIFDDEEDTDFELED